MRRCENARIQSNVTGWYFLHYIWYNYCCRISYCHGHWQKFRVSTQFQRRNSTISAWLCWAILLDHLKHDNCSFRWFLSAPPAIPRLLSITNVTVHLLYTRRHVCFFVFFASVFFSFKIQLHNSDNTWHFSPNTSKISTFPDLFHCWSFQSSVETLNFCHVLFSRIECLACIPNWQMYVSYVISIHKFIVSDVNKDFSPRIRTRTRTWVPRTRTRTSLSRIRTRTRIWVQGPGQEKGLEQMWSHQCEHSRHLS